MQLSDNPRLYLQCELCHTYFEYKGHKRKRWCSDKCKVKAWRNSQADPKNKKGK